TSNEVALEVCEGGIRSLYIVDAVLDHFFDHVVRDRLIPWKLHLLVGDAELDLPLLQTLLLRGEVENIRVRQVVGLGEICVPIATDELLTELVKLLIRVTHVPRVQNMVVVPTAVEAHQL